jgi:hypothetical protein
MRWIILLDISDLLLDVFSFAALTLRMWSA